MISDDVARFDVWGQQIAGAMPRPTVSWVAKWLPLWRSAAIRSDGALITGDAWFEWQPDVLYNDGLGRGMIYAECRGAVE